MKEGQLQLIRKDLSIRGKNGIGFLLAGMTVWAVIAIIFMLPLELSQQNIFMQGLMPG